MNPNEMKLSYPFGEQLPEPGQAIAVADGIKWVRLPLPFALNHVHVWLLRDKVNGRDGWTVVDCGIDKPELRAQWEQVFEQALDGLPIVRVLVTHMHPDHVGLAHWMCERWNAPLWMTMTDYVTANLWSRRSENGQAAGGPNGESAADHFARHGLRDPESQKLIRGRANYYPDMVPAIPKAYRRIMHGDNVSIGGRDWRVIVGYGHAPEHASFYCPELDVLISGDMVLPRISTNVSVFDYEPEANPLLLYLNSLSAYDDVPDTALVLPSHGRPFRGLRERISQQREHHAERLRDLLDACAEPCCAFDILPVLFRRELDIHQMTFAMGEALAHLHMLYFDGKLQRRLDDDGIYRFSRV